MKFLGVLVSFCFLYGAYPWYDVLVWYSLLIVPCVHVKNQYVTPFLCVPYGYHSEQIELISFATLQLENDIPTLSVSQVSSPTIIVERAGSYAWTHKNWRVREEFVYTQLQLEYGFLLLQSSHYSECCFHLYARMISFLLSKVFPFSLFHSC
jgi:hypothetical protein